ncbi:Ubiquitin fusion degradation protein 1-like protein [Operophtera brumata]|uniref:Ubiquitin fusion degradation protein 1-like protein n=1 Tax=Operophtera brumata TaxID=104452 RepID=A0A0L7LL19_OPEBR|nr:Ubiquitin fusion degradation protein 1-like protein [Operophtera brumata]
MSTTNKNDILSKTNNLSKTNIQKNPHSVTKTIVTSPEIYEPVGPYSQAILADKTLYVSGVLGLDAEAQLVCGGAEAQTKQALENLRHVLEAGGASMESVVKTTILLGDMNDFQVVNQVYAEYFPKDYPARATYQVAKLPQDAAVEIEAIALSGDLVVAEAGPCPCART